MKTKQAFRAFCGTALGAAAVFSAVPALAQTSADISNDASVTAPKKNVLEGDHVTIGLGLAYAPSYDGSNDMTVAPFPAIQAHVWGIDVNPRPGGVSLDLIPTPKDARVSFNLGPVVTYTSNRASQIKDSVVRAAGKLDRGVNVGGNAGVNFNRLLNPYDQLTISADVVKDVAGASGGVQISPSVTYMTPVSKAAIVMVNVGARHVDDDYAKYYYSVNATQSSRSGLPTYNAKGGWDSWHTAFLVGYDLSGDLRDGGFEVFAFGNYMKMLNDAADTPYTSIRGSANNWTGGLGIGYTF